MSSRRIKLLLRKVLSVFDGIDNENMRATWLPSGDATCLQTIGYEERTKSVSVFHQNGETDEELARGATQSFNAHDLAYGERRQGVGPSVGRCRPWAPSRSNVESR
jgi:hypothetical protein